MEESFDYSKVPHLFGMCAATDCPQSETCLRRIALKYAPANEKFLMVLNPNRIKSMHGKCDCYRSNKKVRYAKGFMRTVNALTVTVASTFRWRLTGYWGQKNYYRKRKGDLLLPLDEQQHVIALANELGIVLDEYFDTYIEEYNFV